MSVTIDSLDIQIRSSAGSAKKNIDDLANALGNLNSNAKVTKIVNSLDRLNGALTNMKSQQAVMSHLSSLSKSLSSLATLPELTGLKSAVKELKKLPDIMKSLDTAEVSQFASQMKLLASGLEPLAKQIDVIGKGFSKLPPQVSKCVTAVKRLDSANKSAAKSTKSHGEALNNQSFNLLATYEHLSNVFSMIHGIQDAFAKVMNDAIQWDGIQFRFGRAFGEDAEMVLEYARKVSDELRINMQQFMQYSSLYGSLLKGFGVEQEQVTKISVGLTELSYDIWAAHNDRYRTLEEASEAVRSAITGELEPIRNAGIAMSEASMQDYLDSIGMAHVSMEKLTEAQKSEVRYAVMVNGAMQQGIIGTYAREMNTAEGAVRTLTQQLKTLGQALGSLFLPILQKVLPWISAFVELLTEGLIALGRLFGIKFQEIQWGNAAGMKQTAEGADATANALGDAAKNAKAMRDYTMGFDELNIIDPPDASGGAGAGAAAPATGGSLGLDLDTLWDDAVFASASKQIDELKQKIKDYVNEHKLMLAVVGTVTGFLTFMKALRGLNSLLGVSKSITNLKTGFVGVAAAAAGLKAAGGNVKAFLSLLKEFGLKGALTAAFPNAANVLSTATAWVTGTLAPGILAALGKLAGILGMSVGATAALVAGVVVAAIVGAFLVVKHWDKIKFFFSDTLPQWFSNVKEKAAEFFEAAAEKVKEIWGVVANWFNDTVIQPIVNFFAPIVDWISQFFYGCWLIVQAVWVVASDWFNKKVVTPIVDFFSGLWVSVKGFFSNLWADVKSIWNVVSTWFNENVVIPVVGWFRGVWTSVSGFFSRLWADVKVVWETVASWFDETVITPLVGFFDTAWTSIEEAFETAFTSVRDFAVSIINGLIGYIESGINSIIRSINSLLDGFNEAAAWAADVLDKEWGGVTLLEEVSLSRIQVRENGGFLEDGLFTMNHGEIAGKFNNGKSVVANNQQIVDGIAAGVYEAVVAAMRTTSGSGNQNVNVYLDGRQITAAVEKRQSERGMQLVGNQLGYAF